MALLSLSFHGFFGFLLCASPPLRRIITWLILKNSHPSEVHGSPRLLQCGCWVPNSPNNQEIPIMRVPCWSEKVAFCRVRWNWRCLKTTTHTIIDMGDLKKANSAKFRWAWRICWIYQTRQDKHIITIIWYIVCVYIYICTLMFIPPVICQSNHFVTRLFEEILSVNDWSNFPTSWCQPWIETDRFR